MIKYIKRGFNMGENVFLYIFCLIDFDESKMASFLTNDDFLKCKRYKTEHGYKEHVASLYLKKRFIGEFEISKTGKPISDNSYFNISHSGEYVVLAISNSDIGVDIEHVKETTDDIKKYISSNEEYEYIKSDLNFFEVWTSKESISKALGIGITNNVKAIPALPLEGVKHYLDKDFYSKMIYKDDYVISITKETKNEFNVDLERVML